MKKEFDIEEFCPHCDHLNGLFIKDLKQANNEKLWTTCENCGAIIMACSLCEDNCDCVKCEKEAFKTEIVTRFPMVKIETYYDHSGEYCVFKHNPLHNKVYQNVFVEFEEKKRVIAGVEFVVDVVKIEGEEPIQCELIDKQFDGNGLLTIHLCQDWG